MELNKLHIHQFGSNLVGKSHSIAGVFPGVGCDRPGFANAASGENDRFCLEHHEAPVLAPVAESAGDAVAIFQQTRDRALHVNVKAHLHAAILQSANHLQAGAVADVAKPLVCMAAKRALQDASIFSSVKKRAPLF